MSSTETLHLFTLKDCVITPLLWGVLDSKPAFCSQKRWRGTYQSWDLVWHFVWRVGLCKHESHDDNTCLACLFVADDLVICSEGKKFLTFTLSPVCKQVFRLFSFFFFELAANCELLLNLLTNHVNKTSWTCLVYRCSLSAVTTSAGVSEVGQLWPSLQPLWHLRAPAGLSLNTLCKRMHWWKHDSELLLSNLTHWTQNMPPPCSPADLPVLQRAQWNCVLLLTSNPSQRHLGAHRSGWTHPLHIL